MNRILVAVIALGLSFVSASWCLAAGLIDFESAPGGGLPTDDAALSAPYTIPGGGSMQFFFDANGNNTYDAGVDDLPIFEGSGPDGTDGFANGVTGVPDTASGGMAATLGSFFLRQPSPGSIPPAFIIDYNTSQTVTALSGEIWDIDGQNQATERWAVAILDATNAPLAGHLSPIGNSGALDGLPWTFSFSSLPTGVDKVRITFIGTKVSGLGLAFNNFTPIQPIPEPSTLALAALGGMMLLALTVCHKRRAELSAN